MPNGWIKRDFEEILASSSSTLRLFPVWLLLGPRQVGKSSLFLHLKEPSRSYINLDDINVRIRAQTDPELFLKDFTSPLLIDEIQYAPQLLSPVKRRADQTGKSGVVWLTGSQSFEVMKGVQESLAGRVAILNLFGLSDHEKQIHTSRPVEYFSSILETTFPKLFREVDPNARDLYLSSYLQTYIERDIRELLGIQKRREFELFVKMCALRTAQIINYDSLARDVGVSPVTIKEWLSLLEDSFLIRIVPPYYSNRNKRLMKSPKIYFLDAGLAAYLAGWKDPEMIRLGPMAGAIFETHIFGNILRTFRHRAKDMQIYFWRTRDGDEIDFLVETGSRIYPLEVQLSRPHSKELLPLKPLRESNWQEGAVVSLSEESSGIRVHSDWMLYHPYDLSRILTG